MSYFNNYRYGKPSDPRLDHDKAWRRATALEWDDKWQGLSRKARQAYLTKVKPPTKEGSYTQPSVLADYLAPEEVDELTAAGFVKVEPGKAKRPPRLLALQVAYDFTLRLRSAQKYNLLGPPNRENLTKYVKYAFFSQGDMALRAVLSKAGVRDHCALEEGLKLYVTTRRWPDWALESCKAKAARAVYEAIRKAEGPVALAKLPSMVKGARPEDVQEAVTDLIIHLVAFEDVDPKTFELIVGLLPEVRDDLILASKPRKRPPLVVCEHPKDIGPPGGLDVNDLRSFLLEVAGESPRLRRDRGIFQKDEPRILAALPPRPAWLEEFLATSPEHRLTVAYSLAKSLKYTSTEEDDKTTWLRLSGKGRNWLAAGFEEQYASVYEHYRATEKKKNKIYDYYDDDEDYGYDYDYAYGDSKFIGVPVSVAPYKADSPRFYSYYDDIKPEQRDALRASLYKMFQGLPVGVFHRWDSVLNHFCYEEHNPLTRGSDPSKLSIMIDRRQIARLPEQVEQAGKILIDFFLKCRLLPLDTVRPAVDAEGKLCIARLPRLDGYFGKPYKVDEDQGQATRVIVQPDFSVVVIGLDPSPAAELAPFCERAGGQAGQGVMTFKITRESVIRAASQGLTATAIVARLKKHASVDVPNNVLREVGEWAGWVRLVNVRAISVVRCPDKQTVARVVSALGKKAERLGDTLVALQVPKLSTAERMKLQEHGILVVKEDIKVSEPIEPPPADAPTRPTPAIALTVPKKRGRPRKVL